MLFADSEGFVSEIGLGCGDLMAGSTRHEIVAHDREGRRRWSRVGEELTVVAMTPKVVVVSEGTTKILALDRATGAPPPRPAFQSDRRARGNARLQAVAVARDTVYVAHGERLSAVAFDGTHRWELSSDALPPGRIRSLAAAPNRLYVATDAGVVFALA